MCRSKALGRAGDQQGLRIMTLCPFQFPGVSTQGEVRAYGQEGDLNALDVTFDDGFNVGRK